MKYYYKLLLATVVLSTGCVENKKVKIDEGPEIFTTLPAELDTFSSGSLVKINVVIGDNDGVHDVTLKINCSDSTIEYNDIFLDHIHEPLFNLDTSFAAFTKPGKTSNFTLEILAVDMLGNSNSKSTPLIVVGDPSN